MSGGLTKKVNEGSENRVNAVLSPSPTREGVPFLVSPNILLNVFYSLRRNLIAQHV
jgi:hypothetical protein